MMPFFTTSGELSTKIYYEIFENVLPEHTLMIHGNMASQRWWYPTQKELAHVYQQKNMGHLILVNFRGCGQSSAPKSQKEVDMNLFAQDFCELVESLALGQDESSQVNLVGHSTGGLIAAIMLAQKSKLFSKAVLLDPVGAKGIQFDESMTSAFEQMKTDKKLVALVLGSTIYANNPDSEFFKNIVVEDAFHAAQTVGDMVLRALDGLDIQEMLKKVTHPVLVLHGEHDVLLPAKDSKELAELFDNGIYQQIDQQGHCANIENPKLFAHIMGKFLYV